MQACANSKIYLSHADSSWPTPPGCHLAARSRHSLFEHLRAVTHRMFQAPTLPCRQPDIASPLIAQPLVHLRHFSVNTYGCGMNHPTRSSNFQIFKLWNQPIRVNRNKAINSILLRGLADLVINIADNRPWGANLPAQCGSHELPWPHRDLILFQPNHSRTTL